MNARQMLRNILAACPDGKFKIFIIGSESIPHAVCSGGLWYADEPASPQQGRDHSVVHIGDCSCDSCRVPRATAFAAAHDEKAFSSFRDWAAHVGLGERPFHLFIKPYPMLSNAVQGNNGR